MARQVIIWGETLVRLKFGAHVTGQTSGITFELGLAVDEVRIIPRYVHQDIKTDDFGPEIPAEVMQSLADCRIAMTLAHWDLRVLQIAMAEAMGRGNVGPFLSAEGVLPGAGTLLGGNKPVFSSGCHFVSLNLRVSNSDLPDWRFPAAYIDMRNGGPFEMPLATNYSLLQMNWRAIPYQPIRSGDNPTLMGGPILTAGEAISSGRVLWDHHPD